ncbi:unnamed protein product [Amoebophrya sp. A120]|nr:unnamed protein product [Amoebophrya sp. A120]|eukprot:GSA120T00024072001.1
MKAAFSSRTPWVVLHLLLYYASSIDAADTRTDAPVCKRDLPADFSHYNKGAQCFASYGDWGPIPTVENRERCARHVGLVYPEDFLETWKTGGAVRPGDATSSHAAAERAGVFDENIRELTPPSFPPPIPAAFQRYLQAGNRIISMWNPAGKTLEWKLTTLLKKLFATLWAALASFNPLKLFSLFSTESSNASLSILAKPGYFETLEELKQDCGKISVLHDMVVSGFAYFYLKDIPNGRTSPTAQPTIWDRFVESELIPSRNNTNATDYARRQRQIVSDKVEPLYFCVHNTHYSGWWGVKASVPYLHLHVTNRNDYPEFVPPFLPWLGPSDFGYKGAWEKRGQACAWLDMGAGSGRSTAMTGNEMAENNKDVAEQGFGAPRDASANLKDALEKVTRNLWELIPPYEEVETATIEMIYG